MVVAGRTVSAIYFASTVLVSAAAPFFAHAQNLQPQTRQELERVFGTGRSEFNPASGGPSTLSQQTQQELNRTFGTTLETSKNIRNAATPTSTRQLQQLPLLSGNDAKSYLKGWHNIALDVTALDHAPTISASPATFHQQFGPTRTARALALVHLAMFEAANRSNGAPYTSLVYQTTEPVPSANPNVAAAAVSEAAFQVLSWLYPGLTDTLITPAKTESKCSIENSFSLRDYSACSLTQIDVAFGVAAREKGVELGREIVGRIKAKYQGDGSARPEPSWNVDFAPRTPPAKGDFPTTQWQIDPVSKLNVALGGHWQDVTPMVLASSFHHRKAEPVSPLRLYGPPLKPDQWPSYDALLEYAGEYRLQTPGLSDPDSPLPRDGFFVAQFWAYDATAGLCAPGRLYNQIADVVLKKLVENPSEVRPGSMDVSKLEDVARYYAVINIAMGDAAIAAWDSKYHFQFPRPVTAIRTVDPIAPRRWYPVGAQVTNSEDGKNITPPFPAYPSGHATFGGALFGAMRQFVKSPESFTFNYSSDEFNGKNKDVYNYVRCKNPNENPDGSKGGKYIKFCQEREFTFDCAERENADSRIFMGVHWIFDADDGIEIGNRVAGDVVKNTLQRKTGPVSPVRFSAKPGQKRAQLLCAKTDWPSGWEAKFGLTNFVTPDIN
jgi:hypothetical protein